MTGDKVLQGRYRIRCGIRLDQIKARTASPMEVRDQQFIFELARGAVSTPEAPVFASGLQVRAQVVFEAILEMICAGSGMATLAVQPSEAMEAVAAFHAAIAVVRCSSLEASYEVAQSHGVLPDVDRIATLGSQQLARQNPRSPLLIAMWMATIHDELSPSLKLTVRMGSGRPRYPDGWQTHDRFLQASDAHPALPISWIPQTAWPGALQLADASALGLETPHGRAFISMCLARYGTTRSWRAIATSLGLPASAGRGVHRAWGKIEAADRTSAYIQAIDRLFIQLHEAPPPIDYERRRTLLWHVGTLAKSMARESPSAKGWPSISHFDDHVEFWATYTGGSTEFAPPSYRDAAWTATRGSIHSPRLDNLPIQDSASATAGEPMTWTPP